MQNMPKSAYMALAKSVGYPTEGEGRKEKLDPFVDLSILIPYHIQQLLELKELALIEGEEALEHVIQWTVDSPEEAAQKDYDVHTWANNKLAAILAEKDKWAGVRSRLVGAIAAFEDAMRSPEDILPDSKGEAEAKDEAEALFFRNRSKFEALKKKQGEAKELALQLAGGDASLSFRLWEVARRELRIRKTRDISKFKEV